jgi:epoxyqueuosine reductase
MAGLGILGENGLVINEKYGSYVFVAELLTDSLPELIGAVKPREIMKCEGCGACLNACPTGRLSDEGECLSDITQKKGELSSDEKALICRCNTAWGCDVCQRVCPHNSSPEKTPIEFFQKELITSLTADDIIAMDEESFYKRAYSWRGKKTILRNLEIIKDK